MGFEIFSAYGAAARGEATLRASGYLFLSKSLMRRIHAEQAKSVVLLYDAEAHQLGVRAASENDPKDAIRGANLEASGTAVNIVPLLRCYEIKQPKNKVKLAAKVVNNDMLVIEMKPVVSGEVPK